MDIPTSDPGGNATTSWPRWLPRDAFGKNSQQGLAGFGCVVPAARASLGGNACAPLGGRMAVEETAPSTGAIPVPMILQQGSPFAASATALDPKLANTF